MKKCIRCGTPFNLPKDRRVSYVCNDCRRTIIETDPQYPTLGTYDDNTYSIREYNARQDIDDQI